MTSTLTQIDPTGQGETTSAWQTYINDLPVGATVNLPHAAQYRHERTIVNNKGIKFIGDGSQKFFMTTPTGGITDAKVYRVRSNFDVKGGTGAQFKHFSIKGANPNGGLADAAYQAAYEAQHCLNFVTANAPIVDDMALSDCYGDFVYVASTPNAHVTNCVMRRNGRQGMTIINNTGTLVQGNDMAEMRRAVFDMEQHYDTEANRNTTIRQNVFGSHRLLFLSASVGDNRAEISNLVIEDNSGTSDFILQFIAATGYRRGPITLARNTSSSPGYGNPNGFLWLFENVDGITATDNVMPLQPNRSPAMKLGRIRNCTGLVQSGNQTPGGTPTIVVG